MFKVMQAEVDNLLYVQVSDLVTKEEIQQIAKTADELIEKQGKINILAELKEFKGYNTLSAFFEDFHYGVTHRDSFNKLAVVGENKIEEMMVKLSSLFMHGEIKYFESNNLNEALSWVKK